MLEQGQILRDNYEIVEEIGSGGGGIVFRARQISVGRDVAIKLIKEDIKDKVNVQAEMDLMKNLHHEYLPSIIDFVIDGDDVYTVMEYIDGKNFEEIVRSGNRPSQKEVLQYIIQLCDVVSYLHSQKPPIIHSDIKPSVTIYFVG